MNRIVRTATSAIIGVPVTGANVAAMPVVAPMTDALLAANAAYYTAFAAADFPAMSALWAQAEDVVCVHPGWPILIGRKPVLESYRGIMSNPSPDAIVPRDEVALPHGDEGRVCCIELVNGMPFAAVNAFRLIGGEWRMIQHQASPIAMEAISPAPGRLN